MSCSRSRSHWTQAHRRWLAGLAFDHPAQQIVFQEYLHAIDDAEARRDRRQLMAYLGLVPSEYSSGKRVARGRITKAGNSHARRVLVEGAWTYRMQARVSPVLHARLDGLPREVREIGWKAQVRLCARYRRLAAKGKPKNLVTTAIAREMAAFAWAIAQRVEPAPAA